jgi:hypothetical protein
VFVCTVLGLVGDHLLLRDFEPYGIFMCLCCYNSCHGNAVTGIWDLRDNIYEGVCLIL